MNRVFIKTFGCPLNKFDEMVMSYYLISSGYTIVNSPGDSDVIIVNTCGVKKQTEDRIVDYVKYLNRRFESKPIVLSGCLPLINRDRLLSQLNFNIMTGPSIGDKILLIMDILRNSSVSKKMMFYKEGGGLPKELYLREGCVTVPIGVSTGCLDKCSFCGTRNARGIIKSMPIQHVVSLIRYFVRRGVKEIYLTSTDLGAYGFDLKPRRNMIDLLRCIMDIDGDFIVRIGMANPRWIYMWLDDLIEIFNSTNKFYYFLHIPVQSGSDRLLEIMRRGHGVEEYIESVKRLRREVDNLFSISTDIIVGHPGEEDPDFQATIDIIKESMPDYVNISKFFPRPNTPAKSMKQLPTDVIKRRSVELSRIVDKVLLERNKLWLGWEGVILINEYGKNGTYMGRNYAYKIVVVEGKYRLGEKLWVSIDDVDITWLRGKVIRDISLYERGLMFS
jgi:MiaB-like tRNA modifying enzyme